VSSVVERLRSWAVAATVVGLTASCAAMPTGGAVHLGRALPAAGGLSDLDVRVLPPSWKAGLEPLAVVSGFLRATVNDDDDFAIARSYLTPSAAGEWRPSTGATIYDEVALQVADVAPTNSAHSTVRLQAPRIGHIDRRGEFVPQLGQLVAGFSVVRSNGSWRIDRAPDGVLLSSSDAQRSFHAADVYYLNENESTLVPDQILLQNSQRGVATTLVSALLSGPSDWLAPAAHTALPVHTTLIGNVPVNADGVADVNLSGSVRQASAKQLSAFSAQLVWTLRQISDVTAVRLLIEGAPLTVPGMPVRQPITAWQRYDPSAPPSSHDVLYVSHGHLAATGGDVAALNRSDPGQVSSVARSRDGDNLAVVQQLSTGMRLLTGKYGQRLKPRLTATSLTAPTFDADGDIVTVAGSARGSRVMAVTPTGGVRRITADATLTAQRVTQLSISRDGARVAAVVGTGRLLVGRVAADSALVSLAGFRAVTPTLRGVRGVSWAAAEELAVTAAATAGRRQIVVTDADGYAPRSVSLERMQGQPIDVAGAPGQPLIAVTDRNAIWAQVEGWRRIATGTGAVHSG
jgi:hypothetical protein